MQHSLSIVHAMWIVLLTVEAVVLARVIQERLARRYPWLTAYLSAEIAFGIILVQIDMKSMFYVRSYLTCTAIMSVLKFGLGWEIIQRVYAHYPGVGRYGLLITAILGGCAALVPVLCRPAPSAIWSDPKTYVLSASIVFIRYQSEIFAGVFLLVPLFFRRLLLSGARWRRNVSIHLWTSITYFTLIGICAFIALLIGQGKSVLLVNMALLVGQLGCMFSWLRLQATGEQVPFRMKLTDFEIEAVRLREEELSATLSGLRTAVSHQAVADREVRR